MSEILLAFLLALIQGITEFLPVSSSAHLVLPNLLFGTKDLGLVFDIATHAGTLLAVMYFFKEEIKKILLAWLRVPNAQDENYYLGLLLLVATLPIILIGWLFGDLVAARNISIEQIAWFNLIFALVLFVAYRFSSKTKGIFDITIWHALLIGILQAFAVLPGASRSGMAITGALFIGMNLIASARFAFLLAIPTILGSVVFLIMEMLGGAQNFNLSILFIGFGISALIAFYTMQFFLRLVEKIGMLPFVAYRMILGVCLLLLV
jgi:undecaprenyl-diphosphatase